MAAANERGFYSFSHEDLVHRCAGELLDGMVQPTVSLLLLWYTALKQYTPVSDRVARAFYTRVVGACALYGETGKLPEHLAWDSKSAMSNEDKVIRDGVQHLVDKGGDPLDKFRTLGKSIYKAGFRPNVSNVTSANQKGRTIWDLSGKRVYSSREGGSFVRDVLLPECSLVLSATAPETVTLERTKALAAREKARVQHREKVRERIRNKQGLPPSTMGDALGLKRASHAEDRSDDSKKPKKTPEQGSMPYTKQLLEFVKLITSQ